MARLACVNVPALPLQLLLGRHPQWSAGPAVVVAEERVQSRILWVNRPARLQGVRPGMRLTAALSLAPHLRAGTVPAAETGACVKALTRRLQRSAPHVEPCREEPGVFWIGAAGLNLLYPDLAPWAERMRADLREAGFFASLVVGEDRFAAYAVARHRRECIVFTDAAQERRAARDVPLSRLGLAPESLEALDQLGIRTVRDLLGLPAVGLLPRFGPRIYRLHRLAAGLLAEGLQPDAEQLPIQASIVLEDPQSDVAQLLFLIKRRLHALLEALGKRREALAALHLRLLMEGDLPRETTVRTAAPSRDAALILDLLRLRLEGMRLDAGVVGIDLLAQGETRELEQLALLPERPGRDLKAGERALARLRAEFGEHAVVRARLREGHLPEARFAWEPLTHLKPPAATRPESRPLVRRLYAKPVALSHRALPLNLWELGRSLGCGTLAKVHGPYTISGGWWAGELHRDYYFAEARRGDVLWIYHDRRRQRWFLRGRVE